MKEKKYYYVILKLDDQFLVDVKAHYFDHSVPVVVLIDKNDGFDYNNAWFNVTQFWEDMTDEERIATRNNFESMVDLFVDLVIRKYMLKKASLDKYYGRKK